MMDKSVRGPYSEFRYSLRFLPHALVLAIGSAFVGVAVAGVLARLQSVWFPVYSGVVLLCLFLGGVVASALSVVAVARRLLGDAET
ncbi:hypothetical protein [Haloprofundus salilacus]|uniref:hypothetical protein n=1 Tax=Haloprofundus salilacus TaxID=2876190 RepID=UPI001CCF1091|nr:hypothetical protein [Haloprofundus salilacus]